MPQTVQNPWARRVRRLTYFFGFAGTFYLVSTYALDRMREARLRALKERKERDLLKAHFTTLLSTISFTLYALLPTLSPQLDEAYPIEATSQALQGLSNPASSQISSVSGDGPIDQAEQGGASGIPDMPSIQPERSDTAGEGEAQSSSSSFDQESLGRDRAGSAVSSSAGVGAEGSVSESWASEFRGRPEGMLTDDEAVGGVETDDGLSSATSLPISLPPTETDLSISSGSPPSEMTASSHLLLSPSPPRHRFPSPARSPARSMLPALEGKSKKELWRDLKIQSVAKAITTAYLVPLLHLLTTSQLSVLARERYLADIKLSLAPISAISPPPETAEFTDQPSLLAEAVSLLPNPLAVLPSFITSRLPFGSSRTKTAKEDREIALQSRREKEDQDEVDKAEAERLYLTYSWWILHEGWREVAQRVEKGVEQVIGPLGLKRELGLQDWEGLILDIRRHVDQSTVSLPPTPFDFSSSLLPPSPLPSTSFPDCPLPLSPSSPHLHALLAQTRAHLSSPDSAHLIKIGVDTMLRKLADALLEDLYPSSSSFPSASVSDGDGGKKRRLAECLPAFNAWAQGVWGALPDSGVEAVLGLSDFEAFAGLIFGDWADPAGHK